VNARVQRLRKSVTTALLASCLQACAGHAVDLDRAPVATADAGGADAIILGSADDPPFNQLAVDDVRLYFATFSGKVRSCLKDDCANSLVTYAADATQTSIRNTLAVSRGSLFWITTNLTILSCDTVGCGAKPTTVIRDPALPSSSGLFADDGYVYWRSGLDIYRCPASGCGLTPELVAAGQGPYSSIGGLGFAADDAYWLSTTNSPDSTEALLGIVRAPKDGSGPPEPVVAVAAPTGEFAVDADSVYWIAANQQVLRCALAGCDGSPFVFDASAATKTDLKVDAAGLYWREPDGALHFCALAGCDSRSAVITPLPVVSYALDSSYLYWLEEKPNMGSFYGSNVHRTRRP
jgi:hypothetical protein